jgi:ribosomal protein S27AE
MSTQNRYCTRCGKTTKFTVDRDVFTCGGCGVRAHLQPKAAEGRVLWGDPFQFRIRFT